jgi:phosphonate transport system substrate-binding protein
MRRLRFTSIQAPNADALCRNIVNWVSESTGLRVHFDETPTWQEREQLFESGEIHGIWMCGLPYVLKADQGELPIKLLAAPVMAGMRYQHQPVYYSDVVVRQDSPYHSFADLRGASWAYNEPHSHSGYNLTCYYLASLGESERFFGQAIQAGAHQVALEMVLAGDVDASAIDSTVLETELRRKPQIANQLRVIERLGPSPIPPWVVHKSMPDELYASLQQAFLSMHTHPDGMQVLSEGSIERFVRVSDRDYDPIREMTRIAQKVHL